jgi:hypothetical protein
LSSKNLLYRKFNCGYQVELWWKFLKPLQVG